MNIATIQDSVDYLASIAFEDDDHILPEVREMCQTQGSFRAVWLYDDVAFKFQLRSGLRDNRHEFDLYQKVDDNVRALMAESYAISECGRVLAMEPMVETMSKRYWSTQRDNPRGDDDWRTMMDDRENFNDHLRNELMKSGFSGNIAERVTQDNHGNNVAYNEAGELRWIDYGWCEVSK